MVRLQGDNDGVLLPVARAGTEFGGGKECAARKSPSSVATSSRRRLSGVIVQFLLLPRRHGEVSDADFGCSQPGGQQEQ